MQKSEGGQLGKALRLESGRGGFEAAVLSPKLKLLDQVRKVVRLRHYSIWTEQSYCDWIRRYVRCHRMRLRDELTPGEAKVEQFLSVQTQHGFTPKTASTELTSQVQHYQNVTRPTWEIHGSFAWEPHRR
jgi:hypothetical protein